MSIIKLLKSHGYNKMLFEYNIISKNTCKIQTFDNLGYLKCNIIRNNKTWYIQNIGPRKLKSHCSVHKLADLDELSIGMLNGTYCNLNL